MKIVKTDVDIEIIVTKNDLEYLKKTNKIIDTTLSEGKYVVRIYPEYIFIMSSSFVDAGLAWPIPMWKVVDKYVKRSISDLSSFIVDELEIYDLFLTDVEPEDEDDAI